LCKVAITTGVTLDYVCSGDSGIKKVGGPVRAQEKNRRANINVDVAW